MNCRKLGSRLYPKLIRYAASSTITRPLRSGIRRGWPPDGTNPFPALCTRVPTSLYSG